MNLCAPVNRRRSVKVEAQRMGAWLGLKILAHKKGPAVSARSRWLCPQNDTLSVLDGFC